MGKLSGAVRKNTKLTKQIDELTDAEKRVGEYTSEEVAKKLGIYSRSGKLHVQAVCAFGRTLKNRESYVRTVKVLIPTGQYAEMYYFNDDFIDKLAKHIDIASTITAGDKIFTIIIIRDVYDGETGEEIEGFRIKQ